LHSIFRAELAAALADLRHLQGFLSSVGREHEVSSLSDANDALSIFAGELAAENSPVLARRGSSP
jgi:hypothetical protein